MWLPKAPLALQTTFLQKVHISYYFGLFILKDKGFQFLSCRKGQISFFNFDFLNTLTSIFANRLTQKYIQGLHMQHNTQLQVQRNKCTSSVILGSRDVRSCLRHSHLFWWTTTAQNVLIVELDGTCPKMTGVLYRGI